LQGRPADRLFMLELTLSEFSDFNSLRQFIFRLVNRRPNKLLHLDSPEEPLEKYWLSRLSTFA